MKSKRRIVTFSVSIGLPPRASIAGAEVYLRNAVMLYRKAQHADEPFFNLEPCSVEVALQSTHTEY